MISAVIGLGQLGQAVARYLAERGADVIAIDTDMARVDAIKDDVSSALCMDATNERALRAAGVSECSTVVLALGEEELEQAALTTMLLRELGVGEIISRAATDVQAKVLQRLGVSRVIFPERQVGQDLARQILLPAARLLVPITPGLSLAEIHVPDELEGQSIAGARVRQRFALNVVAMKRRREIADDDGAIQVQWDVERSPAPEAVMNAGDRLVVVGTDEAIAKVGGS